MHFLFGWRRLEPIVIFTISTNVEIQLRTFNCILIWLQWMYAGYLRASNLNVEPT